MMPFTYLAFITCILTLATNIPFAFSNSNTRNTNTEDAYQKRSRTNQLTEMKGWGDIHTVMPWDCQDILKSGKNKSGIYAIWPVNRLISGPVSVYCDMETDGGGWTVIQRRGDFLRDKEYFQQDWQAYKKGFGDLKEDFWLGNDKIYALSNQRLYSIRFELQAFDNSTAYAVYNTFWIDDENNQYMLHLSGYKGTAGDSMTYHNERKFTTKDRDNDWAYYGNCAQWWIGGWWYNDCHRVNLNSVYHKGKSPKEWYGMIWSAWRGNWETLAKTEIKIRRTPLTIMTSNPQKSEKF